MTLILRIETSPSPQSRTEYHYEGGVLVIGRGEDADWRLNDPDNFISRSHVRVSMDGDDYIATDSSRSGLFVDGSPRPLGPGNRQRLENKMRLRLGDVVIIALITSSDEVADQVPSWDSEREKVNVLTSASKETIEHLNEDPFFSTPAKIAKPEPKPKDLPDPFETSDRVKSIAETEREVAAHPDDPFMLQPDRTYDEPEVTIENQKVPHRVEVETQPQNSAPQPLPPEHTRRF